MPKIIATEEEVKKGLAKFVVEVRAEGAEVDIANPERVIDALRDAVNAEYACGANGSVYDVICDLNDTVGLDDFGISITS